MMRMQRTFAWFALLLLFLSGAASSALPKWTYPTGNTYVFISPTSAEKTLFFTTDTGILAALNKSNGRIEWLVQVGPSAFSAPLYSSGKIYVAAYDGTVQAIDARTRIPAWNYKIGGTVWGSSPVLYKDVLLIGSENGKLYAINATDGKLAWEAKTGGPIRSSALVYLGSVYAGSGDSKLYAFNLGTGKKMWEFKAGGAIWTSSPAGYLDTVFFGSVDKKLYAVNAERGTPVGTFETGGWVASTPVAPEGSGMVYFGSNDGNLYALDARTLEMKWKFMTGGVVQSTPKTAVSSRGTVIYFSSNDGLVYALRANNGAHLWNFSGGDWAGSPVLENNFVYFSSYGGKIYSVSVLGCSIVSPAQNSSTTEEFLLVNGTGFSTEVLRKIDVRVNGGAWEAADGTNEWSANLSIANLAYGPFEVECMASDLSGAEEVGPYAKINYIKDEYVPPKEMQVSFPEEASAGQKIKIEVIGEDGAPLAGARIKASESELYVTGESGFVEMAINGEGKRSLEISAEGYRTKTIEIEVKQEVGLQVYLYAAAAVIAIIAIIIGLKRRKR